MTSRPSCRIRTAKLPLLSLPATISVRPSGERTASGVADGALWQLATTIQTGRVATEMDFLNNAALVQL